MAPNVDRRRLSFGFAIGYGVVLVLTALNPWFWAALPLFVLARASMTVSNTAVNALVQATSSPRLLGEAVSLYMLAMRGGISLGALLAGASVSRVGVRHAFLFNGLLAIYRDSRRVRAHMASRTHANAVAAKREVARSACTYVQGAHVSVRARMRISAESVGETGSCSRSGWQVRRS